jgi:hypothetical protein
VESRDGVWLSALSVHPRPTRRGTHQLVLNENPLQLGEVLRPKMWLSTAGAQG